MSQRSPGKRSLHRADIGAASDSVIGFAEKGTEAIRLFNWLRLLCFGAMCEIFTLHRARPGAELK